MAKIDTDLLGDLAKALTGTQRLQDGIALAGSGLALPLAQLRACSAKLELKRTELRYGAKSAEAAAQRQVVAASDARSTEFGERHAQLLGPTVELDAGGAAIVGRVTQRGKPAGGVTVAALDAKGEERGRACTDRDGRYAVAVPAEEDLVLALRKGGTTLFRDRTALPYPPAYRTTRDIELADAEPCCEDETDEVPDEKLVAVPDLSGLTAAAARKALAEAQLTLGTVKQSDVRNAVVVSQDPRKGSKVPPGTAVDIALASGAKG